MQDTEAFQKRGKTLLDGLCLSEGVHDAGVSCSNLIDGYCNG